MPVGSLDMLPAPPYNGATEPTWDIGPFSIPVLWRNGVSASSLRLHGMDLSGWETTFWRLPYWYKA
jgi:hypothetical protein